MKPELTDALCIIALDNAIVAFNQQFGFARNETVLSLTVIDDIVAHVVSIGVDNVNIDGLNLRDFVAVVNKIKKSVTRHSAFGPRAYFGFIKDYV